MGTRLGIGEALKLMARRAKKSLAQLSREMDTGTPANLGNMLTRGSIKLRLAALMAACCGYKIVLVPKDYVIEDGIEISGEDAE